MGMCARYFIPQHPSTSNGARLGRSGFIWESILQHGTGAMPTRFNTKDSGRRTESLTAMTTHALENDRFPFCTDASWAATQTCPGWHCCFSVRRWSRAETRTKTFRWAFRLPGARFCLLLQPETAATFKKNKNKNKNPNASSPRLGRKCAPAYLRVSVEAITCPAASFAPFWWFFLVFRRLPLRVRQRHVIITEEDCALLCATSGLLEAANERSRCWRRGRRALRLMWSTCAPGPAGSQPGPTAHLSDSPLLTSKRTMEISVFLQWMSMAWKIRPLEPFV